MKKQIRKLGDITGDLEPLIQEMVFDHEMQVHEILGIIHAYLISHCPEAVEVYVADGSSPQLRYGHWSKVK